MSMLFLNMEIGTQSSATKVKGDFLQEMGLEGWGGLRRDETGGFQCSITCLLVPLDFLNHIYQHQLYKRKIGGRN